MFVLSIVLASCFLCSISLVNVTGSYTKDEPKFRISDSYFLGFLFLLLRLSFCNSLSCIYKWDDLLSINSFNPCLSISYLHFTSIPSLNSVQWVYYELPTWPAPSWLDSSVGRALHRYRRGHGFESRSSLNVFQAFFSQLLKLRI